MAYGTPTNPVAGTVITVSYATVNLLDPIRTLRANTGGADPPGTGYIVTSDGVSSSSWKTGATAILAFLGYTPANKAGDTFSGAIILNNSIPLNGKDTGGAARTLVYMDAADNVLLGNSAYGSPVYLYASSDANAFIAVPAGVRTIWHSGNDPSGPHLPLVGGTVSSNITFSSNLTGLVLNGGTRIRDDAATGLQILANNGLVTFYNEAAAVLASLTISTFAVVGSITAAALTVTGAIAGASAAIAGAITGASAAITGAITAATVTTTGLIKGSRLESTVATGTSPLVVASTTQVANLKASDSAALGGLTPGQLLGNVPTSAGVGTTNIGLDAESVGGFNIASIEARYAKTKNTPTYTGNGTNQTITTGWPVKAVLIRSGTGAAGIIGLAFPSGEMVAWSAGVGTPSFLIAGQITFSATGFTVNTAGFPNAGGTVYSYVAIG